MTRIVNLHTNTVHKSVGNRRDQWTACGALRHVPDHHVQVVEDGVSLHETSRCGRCFRGEGGY